MLVFVAPTAWKVLLTHQGAWYPLRARKRLDGMGYLSGAVRPASAIAMADRKLRQRARSPNGRLSEEEQRPPDHHGATWPTTSFAVLTRSGADDPAAQRGLP